MKIQKLNILIVALIILLDWQKVFCAQSVIYATDFGTAACANPAGWTFTGNNMNISLNNGSFGYTGASGGAYLGEGNSVPFINTSGVSYTCTQTGISTAMLTLSTAGYTNIVLSFGMRNYFTGCSTILTYTFEWSADGINYIPLSFIEPPPATWGLPSGNGLIFPPGADNQATLFLRWTFNRTGSDNRNNLIANFKIDDFKILGTNACLPPVITVQPVSPPGICATGGVAIFNVSVIGTGPFTYQWKENLANISDSGLYSGTTSSTLVITNPPLSLNGKIYRCVVANCSGSSAITNNNTVLTVYTLPSDMNGDGIINNVDFGQLLQQFNNSCSNCVEDINQDGIVNIEDFLIMLGEFYQSCI